jgi:hypothetical protein
MSTSRARSLSERLDRDGAESVLRKAKEFGGDAVETARGFVALQQKLDTLRASARKTETSEETLAGIVDKTERRLAEGGDADDAVGWRKPPFPQTEEETKAMADELSPGEGGEKEAAPAPAKSAKEPEPTPAPAVKRAKEAEKSDSGVVNLKALAEDYYRTKAAREVQTTGKLTAAAAAGAAVEESASPRRKKQPVGAFIAIAAGLIAVCGVLVYLLMSRPSGDESSTAAQAPAGSTVAAGPAMMAAEPEAAPAVELPPPPDDNASAEELERYRSEVEQLKAQLAQQEATKAAPPVAPEAAAAAEGPAPVGTARTQTTKSGTARTGSTAPRTGSSGTTTPRGTGTTAPATSPPTEGTAANPLISMLGGRPAQGTGTQAGSTGTTSGGTSPGSTEGGDRVAGSLSDLGITNPHPTEPAAPTEPATPAAVTPPPPPPEENLPETLGRPEIRRGTESVKSSVLGCGSGNIGTITVEFTVSGTNGGVTTARVTGEFAGTAIGACAESAARKATFARFRRSTFTFTFPFVLPIQ